MNTRMKLPKTACLLAFLLLAARCLSQDSLAPDVTNITRVTFLSPGLSHEVRLARAQTLYVHPSLSVSASWGSTFGFRTQAEPSLAVHYRRYYNLEKRVARGRSASRNSGNYVAAIYDVTFTRDAVAPSQLQEIDRRPVHLLGAAWGLQRNGHKRFCLDLNLGAVYLFARGMDWNNTEQKWERVNVARPLFYTRVSLGFWLGKRE